MRAIELFAGAGGLAQGLYRAGVENSILIERDSATCQTLEANKARGFAPLRNAQLVAGDVRVFDYRTIKAEIDLVTGGPPCQPFSLGGKHRANLDQRDMFPEAIRAIRELRPRAFLFENVKGLTRASFQRYFIYLQLQLTHPLIALRPEEGWLSHLARLEQHHTQARHDDLGYRVVTRLLNAADYGVPQHRERVFFVGFRNDIQQAWSFPDPTHSQKALLWEQCVTRGYWERHNIALPKGEHGASLSKLPREGLLGDPDTLKQPWVTVRDAFVGLPDPATRSAESNRVLNHDYRAGARRYKGHTGSSLDAPAKTLKAGDHGVPGGENMVVLADGGVRYFTVRESARLQSFPDSYYFPVPWTASMRQLGNAVPVLLAERIASTIAALLRLPR